MGRGRPAGTAQPIKVTDPPIEHEGPGRPDKRKPDHCDSCSVPERSEKLLTFRLWSVDHSKWAGEWTLCERCWLWRQGRQPLYDPDPLYVPEEPAA